MLTVEQARDIARTWREKFTDEAAFELSWTRYFDPQYPREQSPGSLVAWLETDQQRDAIKAAGIVREPVLPTQQSPTVVARFDAALERDTHAVRDCWQCGKLEHEPAGERCANPRWHWPNVNQPRQRAVPGWKHVA
jgi:hypothetical protein